MKWGSDKTHIVAEENRSAIYAADPTTGMSRDTDKGQRIEVIDAVLDSTMLGIAPVLTWNWITENAILNPVSPH
jgi:hypothetical protein